MNTATAIAAPPIMSTALALDTQNQVAASFDEKGAMELVTGFEMLPRLQLNGGSAELAKSGAVPVGSYVVIKKKGEHIDLGKTVDCFVLSLRMKALAYKDDPARVYYDPKSVEFKEIVARQDRDGKESGCMAGWDFLCYLPSHKMYVSFFLASKSARNEGPAVRSLLGKAMTLSSSLAENKKKDTWLVPKALACTKPLEGPNLEEANAIANRFVNASPSSVKVAPVATAQESERAQ